MDINQEESKILSQMAYMNIDKKKKFLENFRGSSLQEMAKTLLQQRDEGTSRDFGSWGSFTNKEQYEMLTDIAANKYPGLSSLKIKDYQNHEGGDNFVGYAFSSDNNPKDVVFAFRGTMGSRVGDPSNFTGKAWLNNYNLCVNNASLQFPSAKAFVEQNRNGGEIFVTGHSQGGGDALYICATFPKATGCVFDAPGIGQTLAPNEKAQLKGSDVVNIVNQYDPVGASMEHLENRIYAKFFDATVFDTNGKPVHTQTFDYNRGLTDTESEKLVSGAFMGHYLQTIHFEGGKVIQGDRSLASSAVETATKVVHFFDESRQAAGSASLGGAVKTAQTIEGGSGDVDEINQMQKKLNVETSEQKTKQLSDAVDKAKDAIAAGANKAYDAGAEAAQKAKNAAIKLPDATVEAFQEAKTAITNSDTYKGTVKAADDVKTAITNSDTYKGTVKAADDVKTAITNSDTYKGTVKAADDVKTAIINSDTYKTAQDIYNKLTPAAPAPTEAEKEAAWNALYKDNMDNIAKSSSLKEAQGKINTDQDLLANFKKSGLNVDNDISFITTNLKAHDTEVALAAWNTQYKDTMAYIANSESMKEAQGKINTYQDVLANFKKSGLNVDNDISFITTNLTAHDAQVAAEAAAWNDKYLNMLKDIQNSPTREDAQKKIAFYHKQKAIEQFKNSGLNVDNDIQYITDHLQAKDNAQSYCRQVIQDVQDYAQNNTFFSDLKQKVQSL